MSQTSSKTSRSGYLFGIASAVIAGLIPVLSKPALVSVGPLTISVVVFLVAGLIQKSESR